MFEYFKKLLKTKCDEIEAKTKDLEKDIDDVARKIQLIKNEDKVTILRNELERLIAEFADSTYRYGQYHGFSSLQEDESRKINKYKDDIKECIDDLCNAVNENKSIHGN